MPVWRIRHCLIPHESCRLPLAASFYADVSMRGGFLLSGVSGHNFHPLFLTCDVIEGTDH